MLAPKNEGIIKDYHIERFERMSKQKNNVFVRALPQEITITETYRYTAEISENDYLSFENASGDIKAKFFYDGQGDHNWSLSELWSG